MGKEMKITCDSCGANILNKNYINMRIQKMLNGKLTKHPSLYLCPKCFNETKLALLLCDMCQIEKENKSE